MSYNKFKDSTIYGKFVNDSSGVYIADASFNGNITCNGNINLSKSFYINGSINLGSDSKIYNSNGTEFLSGFNSSLDNIKIGGNAGLTAQNQNCIAIGGNAGATSQGIAATGVSSIGNSIAIGLGAGETNQTTNSISIGKNCGNSGQGYSSIAIGRECGKTNQGFNSISIGTLCGETNQAEGSYALGQGCGQSDQQRGALAIGYFAGRYSQGEFSISLGVQAGYQSQHARTIVINADDNNNPLNTGNTKALYIHPIRNNAISTSNILAYDPTSKEVFYTNDVVSADVSNNYLRIVDASSNYLKTVDVASTYLSKTDASNNYMKIGTPTTGTINATNLNVSGKMTTPFASFTLDSNFRATISSDYSGYFIQVQSSQATYGIVTLFSALTFGGFGNPNAKIQIQNVLGANKVITLVSTDSTFYSNGNNGAPAITLQYLEIVSLVSNGHAWSVASTSHPPLTTKGIDSTSSIYTTNVYSRCSVINTNGENLSVYGGGVFLVYATLINMPTSLYYSGYEHSTGTFKNKEQQPIFHIFNGSGSNNLTITFATIPPNTINYPPEGCFGLYGRNSSGLINGVTDYVVLPYQCVTITTTGTYWLLLSISN